MAKATATGTGFIIELDLQETSAIVAALEYVDTTWQDFEEMQDMDSEVCQRLLAQIKMANAVDMEVDAANRHMEYGTLT